MLHMFGISNGCSFIGIFPLSLRTFSLSDTKAKRVVILDMARNVIVIPLIWYTVHDELVGALGAFPVGGFSTDLTRSVTLERGHCCFVLFQGRQVSTETFGCSFNLVTSLPQSEWCSHHPMMMSATATIFVAPAMGYVCKKKVV